MIISHRKKFAFFRAPKTGTTTATFFLRICGAFNDGDIMSGMHGNNLLPTKGLNQDEFVQEAHYTPAEAIGAGLITLEQLREYRSVAILREPVGRQLSALIHQTGRFCDPSYVAMWIEKYDGDFGGILQRPQSEWFYVNGELVLEPLLMDNYDDNLRNIIRHVGGIDFPLIPSMNNRDVTKKNYPMSEWITPEFIDHVERHYAEDIALYQKTMALFLLDSEAA